MKCVFSLLALSSIVTTATAQDGFTIATDRDLAANFKRCFFYKRLSVIRKERVSAFDIDECKSLCDDRLECVVFQQESGKCIHHIVMLAKKKELTSGISNCDKPGVPSENAPACVVYPGAPNFVRHFVPGEVGLPVDCANICDSDKKCVKWQHNRKNLKCKLALLEGKGIWPNFVFGRKYCLA